LLWKRAPASKPTLGYGKGPVLGPRSSEAINRHATRSAGRPFCEGPEVRRERKVHRDRYRASKWKPRLDQKEARRWAMGSSLEDTGMVKGERESGKLVADECNSQSGERKWGRAGAFDGGLWVSPTSLC
jgi:hypothetical protein